MTSCLPLIAREYDYVYNANGLNYECWIKNGPYQFCLYAPLLFYFLFSTFVVVYCLFVKFFRKQNNHHPAQTTRMAKLQSDLTNRLTLFTFVFVISWSGAVIDRIYDIQQSIRHPNESIISNTPKGIVWWHDIGVASVGLTDAIVWGTSSLWKLDSRSQGTGLQAHGSRDSFPINETKGITHVMTEVPEAEPLQNEQRLSIGEAQNAQKSHSVSVRDGATLQSSLISGTR